MELVIESRSPKLLREWKEKHASTTPESQEQADERGLQELRRRAWVLLPSPICICSLAGVLVAFGAASVMLTIATYFSAGLVYGLLLWWLAQQDLLIFGWEDRP